MRAFVRYFFAVYLIKRSLYGHDKSISIEPTLSEGGQEHGAGTRGVSTEAWRLHPRIYDYAEKTELRNA